jgi:glycosyltransferase involved in cell wall biosynthesis
LNQPPIGIIEYIDLRPRQSHCPRVVIARSEDRAGLDQPDRRAEGGVRIIVFEPWDPAPDPPPFGESRLLSGIEAALRSCDHEVIRLAGRSAASGATFAEEAARLVAAYRSDAPPDIWLSCLVSNESVDGLGPTVSAAVGIPYVLVQPRVGDDSGGAIRDACAGADGIIIFSSGRAGSIRRYLTERPERLVTLRPFVDIRRLAGGMLSKPNRRATWATKLRLPGETPWIIAAGPMTTERHLASFQTVARAMSPLSNLPWNLVVAGSGSQSEVVADLFRHLPRARYRQVPMATGDELFALLLAGDLFLWPSVDEDYAITALEAQAAGLAVVAAKSSGMLDVVAHDRTGMLVKTGNIPSISNAVSFLLRHPEFRRSYAQRGPEWVAKNFDLRAVARELDATLRRIREMRGATASRAAPHT